MEKIAFDLKVGQVSALQQLQGLGWIVVKCIGHVPPATGIDFEKEKPSLAKEVIDRRLEQEIPKMVEEMQKAASTVLLMCPRREWSQEEIEKATGVPVPPRNQAPLPAAPKK